MHSVPKKVWLAFSNFQITIYTIFKYKFIRSYYIFVICKSEKASPIFSVQNSNNTLPRQRSPVQVETPWSKPLQNAPPDKGSGLLQFRRRWWTQSWLQADQGLQVDQPPAKAEK